MRLTTFQDLPVSLTKTWREQLKLAQAELRATFHTSNNTPRLLTQHARLIDQLLRDIWQQSGLSSEVCLIAAGGYGRAELFPHSDVDLLILIPDDATEALNKRVESVIGIFWDIGLAVGHSVRTLNECVEESQKDVTIQTNLLETRHLIGNKPLFAAFSEAMSSAMDKQAFFEAKLHEQEQRHKRFNDTAYNLEPNIKESPGGLRDLQNVLWISKSIGLGDSWASLVKHELITHAEMRQILRHQRNLQMLRVRLHYLANRREDRLIFDFQNELAAELGFSNTSRRRASEQLMYTFYRSAKFVSLMNEILLNLLKEHVYPTEHPTIPINNHFEAKNGLLQAKSTTLLQREPSTILECFLVLAQHSELNGMSPSLLRALHRVKKLVNREFRNNPTNKHLFMEILKHPSGITKLNRHEILGKYIPAFGRIVGQMQHDLFHVYTVDEHILNVLRNLRRFALPQYAHEFPLCTELFLTFDKPYILFLGALFHDIAKGRGGDHSTLGCEDAKRFCKSHGLNKDETTLVAWLVQSHLTMSSVAQKTDLSDPKVIEDFARLMESEYRLTALYLLTVADIRGTSPKVWNAWKGKLLESLFLSARRLLRGAHHQADAEVITRQNEAKKTLSHYGIAEKSYLPIWNKFGKQYFVKHESSEIAWQTRLLLPHIDTKTPIVRSRLSPRGDGIQVMIYTPSCNNIFAKICSFFERINYTILEAKVHTTPDGYALDNFLVLDQSDKSISYRDLLNYIEFELTQKLSSSEAPEQPLKGRLSRQVKHMPIQTTVNIKPDSNSNNHSLEIITGDRPGLLSIVAHIFLKHHIDLQTAKINTLGKRAEDSFLISKAKGVALSETEVTTLKQSIIDHLTK